MALVVALVLSVGCNGNSTTPIAARTAEPTPRPRPLPTPAESSADVDPYSQSGQQVFITTNGFRPQLLFSIVGEAISFINETDRTVTVESPVLDFSTGPLRPGGKATYTPEGAYSIVYHLTGDQEITGRIQVGPYFDPGEDPAADRRLDADTPGESRRDQVWR